MREIKCRGQRWDTKEWVYGSYYTDGERHYIITEVVDKNHALHGCRSTDVKLYVVIPETVGQYTGHKDKNKEEIYEGDIVLYDRNIHEDIDKQKFKVIWMQDGYCLKELEHKYILDGIWWETTEKIGTIWENPELLKEVE